MELKRMMRLYMAENPNDWDNKLQPLLYAYQDIPQVSTGFSPFELLFGRKVRGLLDLLQQNWEDNKERDRKSIVEYFDNLINTLQRSIEIAGENLKGAQGRQKSWYDKKA